MQYEIDLNGNPFNDFTQGSDTIRVTKLLTNNWNKDEDVFRISKVKDGKPKHSVDVTDNNFTKIHKAAQNLPDTVFEIGGAIQGVEGPFIITDIYGTDLLYTTGLGRTAPVRISYNLDERETYIPKDKFELTLHNTLKGRDWIIWDKGEFYLLFHFEDKIYKKIKFNRTFDQNSFYRKEVILENPEYVCKPYQIDTAVFIEDVTYNDSPQALDILETRSLNKPYQAENIPFQNIDARMENLQKHILRKYPNDFLPMQWEERDWDNTGDEDMDAEFNYDSSSSKIPFRVLDRPNVNFTYSPFRRNIVSFGGYEMYVSLNSTSADNVFTNHSRELSEFIKPGKSEHAKKYDHIRFKDRDTHPEYKEYVNPSPLKEGYLKLRANISEKMELIPNRDIPIRDYNEPLLYCLYRDLGDDERIDEAYFDFKPQYRHGDKVILKPSDWNLAQWDYVGERDENNKQVELQGKELEDSWIKAINEVPTFKNYTIKWKDGHLWCNENKTMEERTFYITKIDFREDHFVYHSYRPTTDRNENQILREEEIMGRVTNALAVKDNKVSVEI